MMVLFGTPSVILRHILGRGKLYVLQVTQQ